MPTGNHDPKLREQACASRPAIQAFSVETPVQHTRRNRGTWQLLAKLSAGIASLAIMLSPAHAAKIYMYSQKDGKAYITNVPELERALENDSTLVKVYRPVEPVQAYPSARTAKRGQHRPRASEYDSLIRDIAHAFGQDSTLIKAIVQIESGFNPAAISPKGAQGLMQLMPATAAHFRVSNPFDPEENLIGGVLFLQSLLKRYRGDLRLTLAAYHAGEPAVTRYKGVPPYPETQAYVENVTRLYRAYHRAPALPMKVSYTPRKPGAAPEMPGNLPGTLFSLV